jgi:translocation and assembly module TamB
MSRWRALVHAHVGAALFSIALVAGTFFHLARVPLLSRLLVATVNRALEPVFSGRLHVDRVTRIGWTGVVGLDGHVDDARSRRVLTLEGVDVRLSTLALLRSLAGTGGPIQVEIPDVNVTHADVALDPDPSGVPRVARAFEAPTSNQSGAGRSVTLSMPHAHLGRVSIHPTLDEAQDLELDDADASLLVSGGGVSIDLDRGHLAARGLPNGARADGIVQAHFEQPASGDRIVRASWDGSAGPVRERADLAMRGDKLDAAIDVAPVGSAEVCVLLPQWPIAAVCSLHAEGHGTLQSLDVGAHALLGSGTLDVGGTVSLGDPIRGSLHLEARKFDGRTLVSPIPCSNVDLAADVTGTVSSAGDVNARSSFQLSNARCGATSVPPISATSDLAYTHAGDLSGHADVAIRQPGATTSVALTLAGGTSLWFEAATSGLRLQDVAALGGSVSGQASAQASGKIDLRSLTLDARASAAATDLRAGEVAISKMRVEGHAWGRLLAPAMDLETDAESVRAPAVELAAVHAEGQMTLRGGPALHDVHVDFAGEGPAAHASASFVGLADGALQVEGAVVSGLGEPLTADLRASPSAVTVRARCPGLELERLTSFAALPIRAGKLAFTMDGTVTGGSAEGSLELRLAKGSVSRFHDVDAHIAASLHGRGARGTATITADGVGNLELHSNSVTVGRGPLLTAGPWRNAWGAIEVRASADLAKVAAHLPRSSQSADIRGQLDLDARVARESQDDMTPEVDLTARTVGLSLRRSEAAASWIEGVDPIVHVVVNGDTGATSLEARINAPSGTLATLNASSDSVPYSAFFSDSGVTGPLLATPFSAAIDVPTRRLDTLPASLGLSGRRGELTGHVTWKGTAAAPVVDIAATLLRGKSDPKLVGLPVDLSLTSHYEAGKLDTDLHGVQRGVEVARARLRVAATAGDWFARGSEMPWVASAQAQFDRFPLRSLDLFDEKQITGTVSGAIAVEDLHDNARASASVTFDDLHVGDVVCKLARMTAAVAPPGLDLQAHVEQTDGGSMTTHVKSGVRWGSALLPRLDSDALAVADVEARRFRARLFLPFVSGVTELDGRLDGDASVEIDPARGAVRPRGSLALTEGTFELGSLGTQFHGISARADLTPDGVVRLRDAVAYGTSGKITAAATAWMTGTSLGGVKATLRIPSSESIPLVFDGVQLGKIDGAFDVGMTRKPNENDVDVTIPTMSLDLATGSVNRDVQTLGDIEGMSIGRSRESEFVLEPLDGPRDLDADAARALASRTTSTIIDVHLGHDVQVRKGSDLDVRLAGHPRVTLASSVRVSGQIHLERGSIEVQGKPFEIEKGTVTFVEDDPSNPQVVLTAGWIAPDGTHIFANFLGPLKTGKVTLRSEPARPQNEILALILFGTTDQQDTNNTSQTTSMAVAAGGVATQPLNQALGGVNHALDKLGLAGGISTKIDTSTPNPRPEVEVQIARDISFQVAWVLGQPPPGTDPDMSFYTLYWRFLRNWTLETTVGDAASSIVDVVWQHRY